MGRTKMHYSRKRNTGLKLTLITILSIIITVCIVYWLKGVFLNYNSDVGQTLDSDTSDTETSEVTQIKATSTINIANTGDILIHSPLLKVYLDSKTGKHNFDGIFSYISPYINKFDYAVANLECSISKPEWGYSGYPQFKIPHSIIDSIQNSGFDMVLTANNHTNDGGAKGVLATIDSLKSKNVDFIGLREDSKSKRYLVKDINGIKVGMINYTYGEIFKDGRCALNGIPMTSETSMLINVFDYSKLSLFYSQIESLISDMRNDGVNVIILYIHWGNEYMLRPNDYQKSIAQKMCDLGVDVIVGGHPHVVQPVGIFKSADGSHIMPCLYSMGNAVSNQRTSLMDMKTGHTEDGLIFTIEITKYNNNTAQVTDIDVLPTWVSMSFESSKKQYKIIPLDKTVDWGKNFKLTSGLKSAQKSYDRTMQLVSEGIEKFRNDIRQEK